MRGLFNVAGGVRYHLRGLRYSPGAWHPFREALGGWLDLWQPDGGKLVIVGPSAGYCLRPEWLARFDEIACLDPDPLARILFARRLRRASPGTHLSWCSDDFVSEKSPSGQLAMFTAFLARNPGAPVLFSNFLGQLSLLLAGSASDALAVWKRELVPVLLQGRRWASFHDRLSGALGPKRFEQPHLCTSRLSDGQVLDRFYDTPSSDVALVDHDTEGFFPARGQYAYFRWDLTPGWIHLIEATRSD